MRRLVCALLGALLGILPAAAHDRLGANLNLIADFSRNHEFVDLMRQAREFGSFADPFNTVIAVGPDGWPTGDFGVTLMDAQGGVRAAPGTYKVVFNGRATVTSAASGTVANATYDAATNESRVDVVFPEGGETLALRFAVAAGPASNAVKNLRVLRPGFDPASHPAFTPEWLAHVQRFRVLRLMDWLSTNHRANSIVTWADRPTLGKKRTEAEGARWETVIELANAVQRDIWINIPVRANDEYVRNLATQLRDGLPPNVNVYVEYSNELWNGAFDQFAINRDLAAAEASAGGSVLRYDGSSDPTVWAFRRVAKRSKEISDLFASVWGAAAINTRIRVVLAGQMANAFIVEEGLEMVRVAMQVAPSSVFYAISGAPYIFPSADNDASADEAAGLTSAQILDGIAAGVANARRSYLYEEHAGLGAWYGLKILGYEGGFDTFGGNNIAAKRAANLDPAIRTHCRALLDGWFAAGFEDFLWFNAGAASYETPFGQWPLLEDMRDAGKPKNQCMDDVLAAALPAITLGHPVESAIPASGFQGAPAGQGALTNTSGPFGFPGYVQFLLRVAQPGTYQIVFRSQGSSLPRVGVHLNGVTLAEAHALPEQGSFSDSLPLTVTLRAGINALRLTRPPSAGTWTIESISVRSGGTATPPNHTALWWNPSEPGWGINVNHQGDLLFATLFTYAADGRDLWLVASGLERRADGSYSGSLFRTSGPAFNAQPWGAITVSPVGSMTLSFGSADRGTLQYTFNGASVSKAIERQVFAASVPACVGVTSSRAAEANVQDLWWNPGEPGWGLNLTHQGNTVFATLFTYAADGRDLWLVASGLSRQSDGRFSGELFRTQGPAFNASPWGAVTVAPVGTMTLAFSNGERGTITYTFNGATVTRAIERQVFASPTPACR